MSACGFYLSKVPPTISLQLFLFILMFSISLLCDRVLLHTVAPPSLLHIIQLDVNPKLVFNYHRSAKEDLWQTTK
jgi:hypothetical protein